MVTDRHIFVIGQQWILGPQQFPDVRRVIDRSVEVGIVADQRGLHHGGFCHGDQQRRHPRLVLAVAEQVAQPGTQQ